MKNRKALYLVVSLLCVLVIAGTLAYMARAKSSPFNLHAIAQKNAQPSTQDTAPRSAAATLPATFLGTLQPGGSAESADRERTYVVSYQVAFFRKSASEKSPEEGMSYEQLQQRDMEAMPPYVYYGEDIVGKYDPAHPESIAVRTTIDGKEVKGYIDSAKLWLEPVLKRAESNRYMALRDGTSIYVVPDPSSPPALTIMQGEVLDIVGRIDFQGKTWIKAQFNPKDRARFGYIASTDLKALTLSTVNQSALSLEEVPRGMRNSKLVFGDSDRQKLTQNGFYIEPVPPIDDLYVDDMADSYQRGDPQVFVTSDLYLHSFHLIFDRMLQDLEEKKFFPVVSKMAANLTIATEAELRNAPASAPQLRDALHYDLLYFSVAARLFDPSYAVPEAVKSEADALVPLIEAGGGQLAQTGNLADFSQEDFTQYKVRGHYEKNDTLKRYFRGMMWFGRRTFLISKDKETLAAILVPSLVEKAQEQRNFQTLDALITYLIGRQDKYTFAGYRGINRKIFGSEAPTAQQLTTRLDEHIGRFRETAVKELPSPQIVSVATGPGLTQEERLQKTAGFKFLGQRYVLDAFILNQLTSPNVGSDSNPRNLPSALDVMMILGSKPATEIQKDAQKQHGWVNYDQQTIKLKRAAEEQLSKRATFYEEWLFAVKALFQDTGTRQFFALGEPWQYKNLNAGLASWTELKHDTILYAEQSAAEMGEGGEFEIPPFEAPGPKGYVEPNPTFFAQVTRAVDQMLAQLKNANLATDEYVDKFTTLRELAHRAEIIARKEVAGEAISADDYEWIANIRYAFDRTLLLPRDVDSIPDSSYLQMALVADVATDGINSRVLEEGIGTPQRIVVVAKDAFGGTRLTVGYVYSWLEFESGNRWSDSEWKKVIYGKDEKSKAEHGIRPPAWYSKFLKN